MSKLCFHPMIWLVLFVIGFTANSSGNAIRSTETHSIDAVGRPIFNYHRNGFNINMKVVSKVNETKSVDDKFPPFPFKEVGHCVIEFSITCVQKRVARFLDSVIHLPEITLLGQNVKLVKLKEIPSESTGERRMVASPSELIDERIDDFFDSFALRITLPSRKGKENQIDVMMEDNADPSEARGGKGGGKGGCEKKCKKGGKGGGNCKKMMMVMMMGLKMKMMGMIGLAAMKGMMFSGMSLMITKMMLLQKFMSIKGGMFGGGGSSGGQLKEVVLLTKGGCTGGSCGGGGGSPPPDSYGAPPPTSGGGGGYDYSGGSGGGGGWGRSFDKNHAASSFVNNYALPESDPQKLVQDEPLEMRPLSEEKWNEETTWKYATDATIAEHVRDSLDANEEGLRRRREQPNRSNGLQPVYARGWRNYEATKRLDSDYERKK